MSQDILLKRCKSYLQLWLPEIETNETQAKYLRDILTRIVKKSNAREYYSDTKFFVGFEQEAVTHNYVERVAYDDLFRLSIKGIYVVCHYMNTEEAGDIFTVEELVFSEEKYEKFVKFFDSLPE